MGVKLTLIDDRARPLLLLILDGHDVGNHRVPYLRHSSLLLLDVALPCRVAYPVYTSKTYDKG